MIKSAALTAQNSAQGKNCYNQTYDIEELRKRDSSAVGTLGRWLGLTERDHPHPEPATIEMCNAVEFAGVQYYSQFWRLAPEPGSTDYIDTAWEFQTRPGG